MSGASGLGGGGSQYYDYQQLLTSNVGALTPVFVEDIVRDRNLDYLEHLAQMVEAMNLHSVWFHHETPHNKMKLLQIYQLSLSYAANTASIYEDALEKVDK